ncbi:MAG TPA: hypothetical protein VFE34_04860 [Dongiaceae bacterium]|jgi:hypothetical protein|nr:hypothetical protein [Dongiaceae bacterium]
MQVSPQVEAISDDAIATPKDWLYPATSEAYPVGQIIADDHPVTMIPVSELM